MNISRMVLSLSVVTCLASSAGVAFASSACNMRDGKSRFASTNPQKRIAGRASVHRAASDNSVRKSTKGKK